MTDPTPEDVAIHNALLSLFCWVDTQDDKPSESKIFINAREIIDECIRTAVEAERERCVFEVEAFTKLPFGWKAALIAAIRKGPDDS